MSGSHHKAPGSAGGYLLDEAHLLHADALTDLRLLLGSLTEQTSKLKIVLCAQEPLRLMLNRQAHADLAARIGVRYRLISLNEEQTNAYIKARMQNAGASKDIFQDEAKDAIHEYAQGNPRQINNIATACLINAAIKKMVHPRIPGKASLILRKKYSSSRNP